MLPVPASFSAKKSQILAALHQPEGEYTDNSPKGTVDTQIRDLIDEINGYEGFVTTSSCAGRVAVFVEGPRGDDDVRKRAGAGAVAGTPARDDGAGGRGEYGATEETWETQNGEQGKHREVEGEGVGGKGKGKGIKTNSSSSTSTSTTSPGGKGGGRWLYVSHDPVPMPTPTPTRIDMAAGVKVPTSEATNSAHEPEEGPGYFSKLFHLSDPSSSTSPSPSQSATSPSLPLPSSAQQPPAPPPRLIHLSFSPLILHVHCATLRHARPLLAAAVNAGFRESGVQSLRALEDIEHGVMVAVRTAGLAFETVVGFASTTRRDSPRESEGQSESQSEVMHRVVSEEYLALCAGVVNERFAWNVQRRERFRRELKRAMEKGGLGSETKEARSRWEDKDDRRRRKREEGLERQKLLQNGATRDAVTAGQGDELQELDPDLTGLGVD
ncbi:uncharacterized protein Z520_10529 [Fonsecaea multimorphosa CBS 102226]|uniref:tRNA(Phe) 7-[(3-amino-3-carboxypropyl)-4-demethylwyosine(37)-N(4)]-methyltransferase n=1 Tax=Fonsecaea multimorphosa CBS 102226 TaxID=1442371 RepID=A0A0D2KAT0_9EURO|nr:uncharacterized protein Z520_10529 [Fonsecaea multimorphosa CBS 102226]KIX93623.1 hypothetical protein Z520_10529 [Fonsecaea multimorphosa CBS 102226]OAL19738.1 hypothetical protein AYO22_09265 [Fonsecaea multimorphosa]